MKVYSAYLLSGFLFLCITSNAQDFRKYSNEFLKIGVGARALAMGEAVSASSEGATAGYWNPAGMMDIGRRYDFAVMHAEYFASIGQYDYLAAMLPIDENSSAGISFIRFGVDNIANTLQLYDSEGNANYDRITLFSAADYAMLVSYARKSENIEGLNYGGNVKLIYRGIGDFASAYGFGFDLGARYNYNKWQFSAMARDVTTTFNAWVFDFEEEDLEVLEATGNEAPKNDIELTPLSLVLGAGRGFALSENYSLFVETDLYTYFDGQRNSLLSSGLISIDPAVGFEFGYRDFVFFRGGLNNLQRDVNFNDEPYTTYQLNVGIGFQYLNISLDYALSDMASQSSAALYSNVFSLRYNFEAKN